MISRGYFEHSNNYIFLCAIGYFTSGNIDLLMLLFANTVND